MRERLAILRATRSVALVGASPNPARPSFFVTAYLLGASEFAVFLVNPAATEIYGRPVFPSLRELPVAPDLVAAFRRPAELPGVAREAIEAGARTLWIQLGLWSDEAANIAHAAGLQVVMNRCIKIEHARFHGGLHLAGFDTGVIDSRRPRRSGPRAAATPRASAPGEACCVVNGNTADGRTGGDTGK
jgi:uncharacterized protein